MELTPAYAEALTTELRARHLHFGDRIHCPFLRPFFLDDDELALVTRVSEAIAAIPGAQVHATAPSGKLVVTLEAGNADEMMSKVAGIQRTDGVLSAALVYQCADSLEAMNEEIPDVDGAQGLH